MMTWYKTTNSILFDNSNFSYPLGKHRAHDLLFGMTGAQFDIDSIQKIHFNLSDDNKLSIVIRYSDRREEEHDVGTKEQYKLYRIMIKETGIHYGHV